MEENEELIKAWIGEKQQDKMYEKMNRKGSFSWYAFFLPGLYITGRKMYLYGVLILLFDLLLLDIVNIIPLTFVFRIIMGFSFYPLYRRHIIKKIKKYENLPYEEQLKKAKLFGGDKLDVATTIILTIMILGYALGIGFHDAITKRNSNINNQDIQASNMKSIFYGEGFTLKYDTGLWEIARDNTYGETLRYKNNSAIIYGIYSGKTEIRKDFFINAGEDTYNDLLYMFKEIASGQNFEINSLNERKIQKINENLYLIPFDFKYKNINAEGTLYLYLKFDEGENEAKAYQLLSIINNSKIKDEVNKVIDTIEFN